MHYFNKSKSVFNENYPHRIWSEVPLISTSKTRISRIFLGLFVLFIYSFTHLFLAVLGLRCCPRAFSSCSEREQLFIAVRGLLIAVASLVAEHGL